MSAVHLVCVECGQKMSLENSYECNQCGASLEVVYDYSKIDKRHVQTLFKEAKTFWDYHPFLPVRDAGNIISLGEGFTPLIESRRIGHEMGIDLYFKDETRNPSCAFKDRPNTVGISVAKELGINTVTIASTGNGGASLAAYAAKEGMKCMVFVPATTPSEKVTQARVHGAEIVKVNGHYSKAYQIALAVSQKYRWANLTSTYLNPYTMEGDKTIAYEMYQTMGGQVPDWIVVPLGAGALLSGIYKGYQELQAFDMVDKLPRMIGVQAECCSPITSAFENNQDIVLPWKNPSTIAGGICDPLLDYPSDGTRTLKAIRKSGGVGVSVSDESIEHCLHELALKEALFCEPAASSSLSAVYSLVAKGVIKKGESVIAMLTGHGLKDVGQVVIRGGEKIEVIDPSIDAFERAYNI